MKSGAVLTDKKYKWFEPDAWRFGDGTVRRRPLRYFCPTHGSRACMTQSKIAVLQRSP